MPDGIHPAYREGSPAEFSGPPNKTKNTLKEAIGNINLSNKLSMKTTAQMAETPGSKRVKAGKNKLFK